MKNILFTIRDLYEWACEKGIEDYTCFTNDEGCSTNIYISEIVVNTKEKEICL